MDLEDVILDEIRTLQKEVKDLTKEQTRMKIAVDQIKISGRLGLSIKEWGVLSAIVTTVCTTVIAVTQIIIK